MKEKIIRLDNKYHQLDGLRAYAAIGIALMHIKANGGYNIPGFISEKIIGSMGDLVFLFMMISAFSMCCGYYQKIKERNITVESFYNKRFLRIFPFFAILCILDVMISPSEKSFFELFANLTLCFGLLPNAHINVIGVGWFIGLIFVFYMIFPFFCYLISNNIRVWISFILAIIFNILCTIYFFDSDHVVNNFAFRSNIIYCSTYFLAGGLIFKYKNNLEEVVKKYHWIVGFIIIILSVIYFKYGNYKYGNYIYTLLPLCIMLVIYSLRRNVRKSILKNRLTKFVSSISMEIYLSHMMIYRIVEKLNLVHVTSNEYISYIITCILVLTGAIVFSVVMKTFILKIEQYFNFGNKAILK